MRTSRLHHGQSTLRITDSLHNDYINPLTEGHPLMTSHLSLGLISWGSGSQHMNSNDSSVELARCHFHHTLLVKAVTESGQIQIKKWILPTDESMEDFTVEEQVIRDSSHLWKIHSSMSSFINLPSLYSWTTVIFSTLTC